MSERFHPPYWRVVTHSVPLGFGTGLIGAGAAMTWFVVVVAFTGDSNGMELAPLFVFVAAIVGALVGGVAAFILGSALWLVREVRSIRPAFSAFAGLLTGVVMRAWSTDLSRLPASLVVIGSAAGAGMLVWRWAAHTENRLRRRAVLRKSALSSEG